MGSVFFINTHRIVACFSAKVLEADYSINFFECFRIEQIYRVHLFFKELTI